MSTIEITDIEHLREGDFVRLRWEHGEGVQVALEGPMWNRMVGGYTVTDARFVSATREVPEWEPGTAGTATVRGVEGVRVMRVMPNPTAFGCAWFSVTDVPGGSKAHHWHGEDDVTSFVPDDAEALRQEAVRVHARHAQVCRAEAEQMRLEVVKYKEAARKYQREHAKECAEVERLRASLDSSTNLLISSNGTIWHHDQNCPNRRTVPTRDQVAEILRARMGGNIEAWHDDADAILALFEQGGAS